MIKKEDLLQAQKQFEGMLTNSEMSVIFYKATLESINNEIAKFPVEKKEDDPMPGEAKELIEAAK